MFKVIVERSRINPKRHKKGRSQSYEDLPQKESMRKPYNDYHGARKQLNENLKPLVRFLKSKVGTNWDKVFSEVCENLKLDSAIQKHVRDHVFDYVRLQVVKEGKHIFFRPKYFGKLLELSKDDLYVDPDTNVLKIYKMNKRQRYKRDYSSDYLKSISSSKSKTILNDGIFYKLFFDKLTKDYTIKVKANSKHAEADFQSSRGSFYSNLSSLQNALDFFKSQVKKNNDYYSKYQELINQAVIEQSKKPKTRDFFQAGDEVEFKSYASEEFQKGIINRASYTDDKTQFSLNITCGTKNISFLSGLSGIIRKVK